MSVAVAVLLGSAAPEAACTWCDGLYCYFCCWDGVDPYPGPLAPAHVGQLYHQTIMMYGVDVSPTFSIVSGGLPPGLTMTEQSPTQCGWPPTGVDIDGTPQYGGDYGFVLRVDSNPVFCFNCRTDPIFLAYSIHVDAACPPLVLSPPTLPAIRVNTPFSQQLTATGGVPPYMFRVSTGNLPPGVSLTTPGLLSGTPTATGMYAFTVTANDRVGCYGTIRYVLQVTDCALTIEPPVLPRATVDVLYSQPLSASGGNPPVRYQILSGSPPPGIKLTSWGTLFGRPAAPSNSSFDVKASDAAACFGTRPYTLQVRESMDHLAGQGRGVTNPNRVRVFDLAGAPTTTDFYAYGATWGTNVASGMLSTAPTDEILTGPGPGPSLGPQVRAFASDGAAIAKVDYYAYGTLKYGVNVGSAISGFTSDVILTAPGPGAVFGPHVRGWSYDGASVTPLPGFSFYAYGTLKMGAEAAGGRFRDSFFEVATGPGPGPSFSPHVRGFGYVGARIAPLAGVSFNAFPTPGFGVRVATGDVDHDGSSEILAAPGAGPSLPARLHGFDVLTASVAPLSGLDVTVGSSLYGASPGAGDVDADGADDIVVGAGPDPTAAATVSSYRYDGSAVSQLPVQFTPFPGAYGVNVATAHAGF